jgi:spermidine/putrescine transport system permease protein
MKHNKKLDNLCLFLVFLFLFLPIVVLIVFSFNTSRLNIIFEGFTLDWYKDLFKNTLLLDALKNTLIVAIISTIVSTVIGTVSAYALHKFKFPFKGLINELLYKPL